MPDEETLPDWVSSPASPVREERPPLPRPSDRRVTTARDRRVTTARDRRAPAPVGIHARRRLAAALVVGTLVGLLLWTLWPSEDSSPSARATAGIAPAVLSRAGSDPTAAAEELDEEAPNATPSPDATPGPASGTGRVDGVALRAVAAAAITPRRTLRVGLQSEQGAGVDATEAASIVAATLGDARGWQTHDRVRFRSVSVTELATDDVDITIVLASPALTDELCAPLRTRGKVSCFNGSKVVLNARRWLQGVPGYLGDLAAYRQYMVNHEVGHALYHGHVECPRAGALAPIMLQQTKGLDGCRPNAWPTLR